MNEKESCFAGFFFIIGATSFSEEKSAGKSLYFLNATMNFFIQTLNGKNDNKATAF
ncbi:MAG: hypothetical protein ACI4DX_12545 [Oliverpabstia sp.]|nr:hypothetical protein [Eubacterium sp.]